MKDYYEKIYEIVENRGEERLRQRKAVMVRRTRAVYSTAGLCAAMIVGFGIWHNNNIQQLANRESNEPEIVTAASESIAVSTKTTSPPAVTTHAASSTNKKTTATVSSTQTTSSVKTAVVETSETAQTTAIESTDSHEQLAETGENELNTPDTEKETEHDPEESGEVLCLSPDDNILDILGFVMPYGESYYHSSKSRISDDRIGEFLGDINLNTVNLFKGLDEVISVSGKIYKIKNISSDCALAVKYDTDGEYHLFSNINYLPETLGQMISDMDLKNEMEIVAAQIDGQAYTIDSEKVWEYLLSDESTQCCGDAIDYLYILGNSDYSVVVNVPLFNEIRVVVKVYADGHIWTNATVGRAPVFDIGKENTDKFIEYVRQYGVPIELPPYPSNANANLDGTE